MAAADEAPLDITRNQLIHLYRSSGKDSDDPIHRGQKWELHQSISLYGTFIVLHPIKKPAPAHQGQDVQSEGVQIEVKNNDVVEVFREVRGEMSHYGLEETKVTGTVPGLCAEVRNNQSFLPSLETNEGFRKLLSDFDKKGGRVPMSKRPQLYRSAAARMGIAAQLGKMGAGKGHVDDAFKGVVDVAGTDKAPPYPSCSFIDTCL